jgi:hypothetical protein
VTGYSDQNLDPETTYFYKVSAVNPVGDVESNQASATTPADAGSNIDLTTSVTVQRNGRVRVNLSWSGAVGDTVDIYRDGSLIATSSNNGSYNDRPSDTGPWTYRVCEAGSIDNCSAEVPATP